MLNRKEEHRKTSEELYNRLSAINSCITEMELYEFRYALENMLHSTKDWTTIEIPSKASLEKKITSRDFYEKIELKPLKKKSIVLDQNIIDLSVSLFAGIISNSFDLQWIDKYFYFDVRAFIFIPRTVYFTDEVLNHLGKTPYKQFKPNQLKFNSFQGIGYRDFRDANKEIDSELIKMIKQLCSIDKPSIIMAIAGPTAAGKTEFSEDLQDSFNKSGKSICTIEIDNFLKDRDYRDTIGLGKLTKDSIHFDLFKECLINMKNGKSFEIPKYDFTNGISSHNNKSELRLKSSTIHLEPGDVIFLEGNFPFLFEEIVPLIDIKIFYLTDDPVRLKRKWKRDIDYRKKYNPNYLCNRYFRTQFLKAESTYLLQLKTCDIAVDTTRACIYLSDETAKILSAQ